MATSPTIRLFGSSAEFENWMWWCLKLRFSYGSCVIMHSFRVALSSVRDSSLTSLHNLPHRYWGYGSSFC